MTTISNGESGASVRAKLNASLAITDVTSGTNTGDQDLSSYQIQPSEGPFVNGDKTNLDNQSGTNTGDQDLTAVTDNAQTGTAYTLVLTDAGKVVSMSNAAANVLTIPTNASVAFAVGTIIAVEMLGAGTTSITGDTGVTVNGVSAGSGDMSGQYSAASLRKSATDTWVAVGSIGTVA